MNHVIGIAACLLPVLIYFFRSPFRPSNADVLIALLGTIIGLAVLSFFGTWILVVGWVAMCAYAWHIAEKERKNRSSG